MADISIFFILVVAELRPEADKLNLKVVKLNLEIAKLHLLVTKWQFNLDKLNPELP